MEIAMYTFSLQPLPLPMLVPDASVAVVATSPQSRLRSTSTNCLNELYASKPVSILSNSL